MEYALYEGDEFLIVGTLDEIAEKMNIKKKSLICYGSPSRIEKHGGRGRILIKIEEEKQDVI